MHTSTSFKISGELSKDNLETMQKIVSKYVTDVKIETTDHIEVYGTYRFIRIPSYIKLVKEINKELPGVVFKMDGVLDASESAGEMLDFCLDCDGYNIKLYVSEWYIEYGTDSDIFYSYEDFQEEFDDVDNNTYNDYKEFIRSEFIYLIEHHIYDRVELYEVSVDEAEKV